VVELEYSVAPCERYERLTIAMPFSRALIVDVTEDQIIASGWASRRPAPDGKARLRRGSLSGQVVREVTAYANKRLDVFNLPLALAGTEFELAVWRAVMTIPFGIRVSYAEVARAVDRPRAHRGVARAMSTAQFDLLIPAHRVIGADGKVKGAGTKSMRPRLLAFESNRTPKRR
jgi:methylated-DNA-[protein]-cysteine S-methyltransferase